MILKPLKCPYCQQLIADIKKGDIEISNSTQINEDAKAVLLRQCNRCKNKYSIELK